MTSDVFQTWLGRMLEMPESSLDKLEYGKKFLKRFGGRQELDFGDA
jgi:hypothetical protein